MPISFIKNHDIQMTYPNFTTETPCMIPPTSSIRQPDPWQESPGRAKALILRELSAAGKKTREGLAIKRGGGAAEVFLEHGAEGALAAVALVLRSGGDLAAARQLFHGLQQPGLLAPVAETHAGLAQE